MKYENVLYIKIFLVLFDCILKYNVKNHYFLCRVHLQSFVCLYVVIMLSPITLLNLVLEIHKTSTVNFIFGYKENQITIVGSDKQDAK